MDEIVVSQIRYEDLIAKEERLCLLETALSLTTGYSGDVDRIKEIFGIEKGKV